MCGISLDCSQERLPIIHVKAFGLTARLAASRESIPPGIGYERPQCPTGLTFHASKSGLTRARGRISHPQGACATRRGKWKASDLSKYVVKGRLFLLVASSDQ